MSDGIALKSMAHPIGPSTGDDWDFNSENLETIEVDLPVSVMVPETIVSAAHLYRLEGSDDPRAVPVIVSAPRPARHHNLFALVDRRPDESGFLTSAGRFVDREEALQIAIAAGQPMYDHPSRHDRLLFSEDLW